MTKMQMFKFVILIHALAIALLLVGCNLVKCPAMVYKYKYNQRAVINDGFYANQTVTIIKPRERYQSNGCNTPAYDVELDDGTVLFGDEADLDLSHLESK